MRKNWKKRLGVWSALTLLSFTLMPVLAAGEQVTTEQFGVTISILGPTGAQPPEFSYQLNGVP